MVEGERLREVFGGSSLWGRLGLLSVGALALVATIACGEVAEPADVAEAAGAPDGRLNGAIAQMVRGEPVLGEEHIRRLGPDYEHNVFGLNYYEAELDLLRPPGSSRPVFAPILRIPYAGYQDSSHLIKQLLDAGFFGFILPMVRNAEEVERFVSSMRYPPQEISDYPEPAGVRGWSPGVAADFWGMSVDEYVRKADVWPLNPDGELLAIVMIETAEAVENIDEILSVPGLGALTIGPADLSLSLGVGTPAANPTHPAVEAAIQRVAEACVRHGAFCGFTGVPDNLDERLAQGFNFFSGGAVQHVQP